LKKHLDRQTRDGKPAAVSTPGKESLDAGEAAAARLARSKATPSRETEGVGPASKPSRTAAMMGAAAAALKAASSKPTPLPPIKKMPVAVTPPLPLPEPEKLPAERKKGAYTFPPLALLDAPKTERKIDERELMEGARLLEEKSREFSVEGAVVQIHPGPVVTTYEFKPDAGVKYSKITGLADDLSLAMQAESVLIDRIPGKSTVGI
jgi:S-DNA-T family DNA segregation ATPase FtsK/SpoIIIE